MLKKIISQWRQESHMQIAVREMKETRMLMQELVILLIEKHNKAVEDKNNTLKK